MKTFIIRALCVGAFVFALSAITSAQKVTAKSKAKHDNVGVTVLKGTGKAAVIVVGTAAKVAWGTTKIVGNYVAKPILLKAVPAVAKFALKKSLKYVLPFAIKLSVL